MSESVDRQNYIAIAARVRACEKWIDTVSSPLWKRVLFVLRGYRWRRLGRWYRARWNADAAEYD